MSITKTLTLSDPSLERHDEGHWTEPFQNLVGEFSSFNDAGVECETGEFLYSMVRMLKPENVLETGTHWGVGASYIGMGLVANGKGHLDTIEFLPENHFQAKARIEKLGLEEVVTCHFGDARGFETTPDVRYGMILLDTEPQTRFEELIRYFDLLQGGGFVFIHDLHNHMHQIPNAEHGFAWPFGKIPDRIKEWVANDELRPFHFHTPRGFTGFYKPSSSDYNWRTK